MGILCDIFIAEPADALRYDSLDESDRDAPLFDRIQFKSLTHLEFGTLWAILEGEEFDIDRHTLVSKSPAESTWLFQFPVAYVKKLAGLTGAEIKKAAIAWGATEELQCEPSEAEELIGPVVDLAGQAADLEKGMFLWGSL